MKCISVIHSKHMDKHERPYRQFITPFAERISIKDTGEKDAKARKNFSRSDLSQNCMLGFEIHYDFSFWRGAVEALACAQLNRS